MNMFLRSLAGVLIGLSAAVPAAAAEQAASPPTLDQQLAGMRRPYDEYRWRIAAISSVNSFVLACQYRAWAHSGLGLGVEGSFHGTSSRANLRPDAEQAGYTSGALTLQYWTELAMRVVPMAAGLRITAGVLGTVYAVDFGGGNTTTVASGGGLVATLAAYATLPLASFIVDRPVGRWWPHLQVEVSRMLEGLEPMTNDRDFDLDGDGIVDHVKGQEFRDASGNVLKRLLISGFRVGLVWIL